MRVLLQRSHHDPRRLDGWSGAPGEAAYIRQEVVTTLAMLLVQRGVEVVVINGDYDPAVDNDVTWTARNPDVSRDHDLFLTCHYDANIYGQVGGWFWDRAAASATAAQDDRFGGVLQGKYAQIPGTPPLHLERRNANTRDYYAFRCTSAVTPGVLLEMGVGAPGAPDHDWLRGNTARIAGVIALAIYEFLGLEDDMTPDQEAKLNRVLAISERLLLEATTDETLVWIGRHQRGLDVERAKPFDGSLPPIDPRIKP